MSEIFNRTAPTLAGVFSADLVRVTLSGGIADTLMQSLNFNYAQQVTRLYEVGSTNVYYVSGRTSGQAQLGRVVGPSAAIAQLYTTYGDVCNGKTNNLQFEVQGAQCSGGGVAGTTTGGNLTITCKYCVLVQVGLATQAQEMIITESSQMMFSALDVAV